MKFLNQFIFRTPLCPFHGNPANEVGGHNLFHEALYLSSPGLLEELLKQGESTAAPDAGQFSKLVVSRYKYQARASHRCTPFGLFAGLGIGNWGSKNEIIQSINPAEALNRKTRLDMNVVCTLTQELARQNFIKPFLIYFPNSSIYRVGDTFRYIEYHYVNNQRHHKINKVDYNEFLQLLFQNAVNGLSHSQLCELLISDEVTREEATAFVDELIASQLLINQLEPNVTGDDLFDVLLRELHAIAENNRSDELQQVLDLLHQVNAAISACDTHIANPILAYREIHALLKHILPDLPETNLFQTDLYKHALHAELDTGIQERILEALRFLNRITPANPKTNLAGFISRFQANYEGCEIPLSLALDKEAGIGYPAKDISGINELVDDIGFSQPEEATRLDWNIKESYLLRLLNDAKNKNKHIVELTDDDFKKVNYSSDTVLPNSISVMFKFVDVHSGKLSLNQVGGNSATCLLGRFAGGNETLLNMVREIADFEQQQHPDQLLAEIVHLPESRTGNILARPVFRQYEIPYLAKSAVDKAFQIDMNDLLLKIVNDRIILFDKRLGKEIIPCLGNAHNYAMNSLPVYHFLCDLQAQYFTKPALGFHWGVLANQFSFLPRAEYKNIILSEARWRLSDEELEPFRDKSSNIEKKRQKFSALKAERGLPDLFLIADSDNELLINCRKAEAIDAFIDVAKNNTELVLKEFLFEPSTALVKDSDGNPFTNECIAVILNPAAKEPPANLAGMNKQKSGKAEFSIGSEWLFYKIYCGPKTADFILTEIIKPLTDELTAQAAIDKWFFIRYADPDTHLRIRFHIPDSARYNQVIQAVHHALNPLISQRLIVRIMTDTYKRELERYGDNSIEQVEQLFCNDSNFVADALAMLDAEVGGTIRWQLAIRATDALLDDFMLTTEDKYELISRLAAGFFNEHGGGKELKVKLDTKFRNLRPQIEEVMNRENDPEKNYFPLLEQLQLRSAANAPVAQEILRMRDTKTLQMPLNNLLASLLHMNLDRLFMGRNRTNEFVVYDMLSRYYKSSLARRKSVEKPDITITH
jgi:thiopeptide-type bacteriocin biosynthesis protein